MCRLSRLGRSNVLPHTVQGSIVFSLGLLPGPVLACTWGWPWAWPAARDRRGDMGDRGVGERMKPGGGGRAPDTEARPGSRKLKGGGGAGAGNGARRGFFRVSVRRGDMWAKLWKIIIETLLQF